jgi:hypothetical protein
MNTRKTYIGIKALFIILMLIFGSVSCSSFDSCPEVKPYFFINGLKGYNMKYTGQGLNPWKEIEENEIVQWDKFFIRFGFEKIYHSQLMTKGGASLYALSCYENGYAGAKVGVDTLFLITLDGYNEEYLQNDTLNNIVLANYWTYFTEDFTNFFSLADFIEENNSNIFKDVFELKFSEPPTKGSGEYQFKLVFNLTNGDVFEEDSGIVKIQN